MHAHNFSIDDNYTAQGSAPGWKSRPLRSTKSVSPTCWTRATTVSASCDDGFTARRTSTPRSAIISTATSGTILPRTPTPRSVNLASYGRYFNIIGNVLGRTGAIRPTDQSRRGAEVHLRHRLVSDDWHRARRSQHEGHAGSGWGNYDTVTERCASWPPRSPRGSRNTQPDAAEPEPAAVALLVGQTSPGGRRGSIPWRGHRAGRDGRQRGWIRRTREQDSGSRVL